MRRSRILPGQLSFHIFCPPDKRIAKWCAAPRYYHNDYIVVCSDNEREIEYKCDYARTKREREECVVVIREVGGGYFCLEHFLELPVCKCGNAATLWNERTKLPLCDECYLPDYSDEYLEERYNSIAGLKTGYQECMEPTNDNIKSIEFFYACHNFDKKRKEREKQNLTQEKQLTKTISKQQQQGKNQ